MKTSTPPIATNCTGLDFNDAPLQSHWFDCDGERHQQFLTTFKPEERLTSNDLKQRLHNRLQKALYHLFPAGKIEGKTFVIGDIQGNKGKSLKVELSGDKIGLWHDFASNGDHGDIFDLWGAAHGWDAKCHFPEIISSVQEWLGMPSRPFPQELRDPYRKTESQDVKLKAQGEWDNGRDAIGNPYLEQKKVGCYGIKEKGGNCQRQLLIPARDIDGNLHTLQTIDSQGRKLFLKGGVKKGHFHTIGELSAHGLCYLAEGYATAASVYEATAIPTICAFDAGNIEPVIEAIRGKYPGLSITIAADNDAWKGDDKNSGVNAARHCAARFSEVNFVYPTFNKDHHLSSPTDFNDLHCLSGLEEVRRQISQAAQECKPEETNSLPAFTVGQLLDDPSPLPEDLIAPRILTPGGLLVFGGAPKVGKTDLLLSWLAHMAAGLPFLGMASIRPLKIFCLQTEIMYDYLRERLKSLDFNPHFLPLVRQNLVMTPQVRLLLDEGGVTMVYNAITRFFNPGEVDVIVIDPLRNVYDPGKSGSENDNSAMLAFLQDRIEKLRFMVNPKAGIMLSHHTKKITKKMLEEDPFQALSGAASLRSFYTTGLLLFRSDEQKSIRQIMFELRNGKAIPSKWVDKVDGRWQEMEVNPERIVRKDYGVKLDAERKRQHDVIVQMIFSEARKGNLYTPSQFCQTFEGQAGLGQHTTIQDRINVLATKGFIKFNREGQGIERSKYGVMCVEGMKIPAGEEVNPETGETVCLMKKFLPTHFKENQTGAILPVENPEVWVYLEGKGG